MNIEKKITKDEILKIIKDLFFSFIEDIKNSHVSIKISFLIYYIFIIISIKDTSLYRSEEYVLSYIVIIVPLFAHLFIKYYKDQLKLKWLCIFWSAFCVFNFFNVRIFKNLDVFQETALYPILLFITWAAYFMKKDFFKSTEK